MRRFGRRTVYRDARRVVPNPCKFRHLLVEGVVAQIGEHMAVITKPGQGIAFARRTAVTLGEHVRDDAEAIDLEGREERREFRRRGRAGAPCIVRCGRPARPISQ